VAVAVAVTGGKVSPKPHQVKVPKGALVKISVASDEPDEVHVHGYDIEKEVAPGKPATIQFTADQTGLFEVETHESGKLLFQLLVR
jgi:hypothetical protein